MRTRRLLLAPAGLALAAAACTPDAIETSADCASLLSQYDQAAATASSEQLRTAATARDEGEKLCLAGETKDGAAKLNEAISQISSAAQ